MFDNIGWGEILVLGVIILIIVGPERLPDLIKDVRAAIFAARRAIANARAELDGNLGEEWQEFREPISQAAEWSRMGPRRAITKALFDGDESALDDFDPKKILQDSGIDPARESPAQAAKRLRRQADDLEKRGHAAPPAGPAQNQQPQAPQRPPSQAPSQSQTARPDGRGPGTGGGPDSGRGNYGTGGGFSWADIT